MQYNSDGTLVNLTGEEAAQALLILESKGFLYGNGECGEGLYSPTWDRMLGNFNGPDLFHLNPSLLYELIEKMPAASELFYSVNPHLKPKV